MEPIRFLASDGFALAGTRFMPAQAPRAIVVLAGAMGVRQDFYHPFAGYLAQQGFAVLTFDYRGMGASVPEKFRHSLRGFEADLLDWAQRDYHAALCAARSWHDSAPLLLVGHSLGGQLPGLLPAPELVDGILTVAAGNGYWRHNAARIRYLVWILWYLAVPLATRLYGYFPGKRMRMVGDLPKGVVRQWAQWCTNPHYVVDHAGHPIRDGFERFRVPLLSLHFTDDELMSRRSIDNLHDCYRNASVERRVIRPQDVNAGRIGHFGFFRTQFRETLWQQASAWLEQRTEGGRQALARKSA